MAVDIFRVSITGSLPSGEVWSINPCFSTLGDPDVSYEQVVAAVSAINAVTVPTNLKSVMNTATQVTGCRVEARSYSEGLLHQAEGLRGTLVPGTGANALPVQSALVISLRTPTPGGRGRGRLYWPATGVTLGATTLRPSSTIIGNMLADSVTFLAAIRTALTASVGFNTPLAVWSRASSNAPTVDRVMIGDVVDVQRRRRDSIPEAYQTAAMTPFP